MNTRGGAIALKAADGTTVTIGDFRAMGATTRTTWGDHLTIMDPGVPLRLYDASATDPLTIWKQQPSVRKVISFAARHVASIPWHAYKRVSDGDRERKADSKLEEILNAPGKHLTGYRFWETIITDRLLYDRWCFVFWEGDEKTGRQDRLVRIPPKLLEIKSNFLGEVTEIIMKNPQAGEKDVDLMTAPVALGFGWNDSAAGGVSPMSTLANTLAETKHAVEWRNSLWQNGPKISGVLKAPGAFKDPKNRERFLQEWSDWAEQATAGGTPLLENGMEYQETTGLVTPKDARDIEGRQLTDQEVASFFHIPAELVGAREGSFGNMKAFQQMLFGPVLGPLFIELQQAVKAVIPFIDTTPNLYAEQERAAAMEGSFLEQARLFQVLVGAPIMTAAEGRARLNLPHLEGTDQLIVPMNVTEGGQANPQDSGEQNIKDGDTTDNESEQN